MLREVFQPSPTAPNGIGSIEAAPGRGGIIVDATAQGLAAVQRLLSAPVERDDSRVVRVVPLCRGWAQELVQAARDAAGPSAEVRADLPTNSLVVIAPASWEAAHFEAWRKEFDDC